MSFEVNSRRLATILKKKKKFKRSLASSSSVSFHGAKREKTPKAKKPQRSKTETGSEERNRKNEAHGADAKPVAEPEAADSGRLEHENDWNMPKVKKSAEEPRKRSGGSKKANGDANKEKMPSQLGRTKGKQQK